MSLPEQTVHEMSPIDIVLKRAPAICNGYTPLKPGYSSTSTEILTAVSEPINQLPLDDDNYCANESPTYLNGDPRKRIKDEQPTMVGTHLEQQSKYHRKGNISDARSNCVSHVDNLAYEVGPASGDKRWSVVAVEEQPAKHELKRIMVNAALQNVNEIFSDLEKPSDTCENNISDYNVKFMTSALDDSREFFDQFMSNITSDEQPPKYFLTSTVDPKLSKSINGSLINLGNQFGTDSTNTSDDRYTCTSDDETNAKIFPTGDETLEVVTREILREFNDRLHLNKFQISASEFKSVTETVVAIGNMALSKSLNPDYEIWLQLINICQSYMAVKRVSLHLLEHDTKWCNMYTLSDAESAQLYGKLTQLSPFLSVIAKLIGVNCTFFIEFVERPTFAEYVRGRSQISSEEDALDFKDLTNTGWPQTSQELVLLYKKHMASFQMACVMDYIDGHHCWAVLTQGAIDLATAVDKQLQKCYPVIRKPLRKPPKVGDIYGAMALKGEVDKRQVQRVLVIQVERFLALVWCLDSGKSWAMLWDELFPLPDHVCKIAPTVKLCHSEGILHKPCDELMTAVFETLPIILTKSPSVSKELDFKKCMPPLLLLIKLLPDKLRLLLLKVIAKLADVKCISSYQPILTAVAETLYLRMTYNTASENLELVMNEVISVTCILTATLQQNNKACLDFFQLGGLRLLVHHLKLAHSIDIEENNVQCSKVSAYVNEMKMHLHASINALIGLDAGSMSIESLSVYAEETPSICVLERKRDNDMKFVSDKQKDEEIVKSNASNNKSKTIAAGCKRNDLRLSIPATVEIATSEFSELRGCLNVMPSSKTPCVIGIDASLNFISYDDELLIMKSCCSLLNTEAGGNVYLVDPSRNGMVQGIKLSLRDIDNIWKILNIMLQKLMPALKLEEVKIRFVQVDDSLNDTDLYIVDISLKPTTGILYALSGNLCFLRAREVAIHAMEPDIRRFIVDRQERTYSTIIKALEEQLASSLDHIKSLDDQI